MLKKKEKGRREDDVSRKDLQQDRTGVGSHNDEQPAAVAPSCEQVRMHCEILQDNE